MRARSSLNVTAPATRRLGRIVLLVFAVAAIVAVALAILVPLGGCGEEVCPCGPCRATVARVIDGDTVELVGGEKVRYLMVDAPESTSGKKDCWGVEAATFNRELVEGREVTLGYDAECRDRYGRLLAWVSVDGREVNTLMIERGYGCVLYLPPSGASREIEFKSLQATAKADRVGVWGACNPVTCEK